MKKLISLMATLFIALSVQTSADAASTHIVKDGESLWKIANYYGVPINQLLVANNKNNDTLWIGERLAIPTTAISGQEKDLLARLVEAEAKGEPYAGKVAVATVIFNRVESSIFPDTISSVIYEKDQFTPVSNGEINKPASSSSQRAVNEAIAFRGKGKGSLYFYNPNKTSNQWLRAKSVTVKIGNHIFAK